MRRTWEITETIKGAEFDHYEALKISLQERARPWETTEKITKIPPDGSIFGVGYFCIFGYFLHT